MRRSLVIFFGMLLAAPLAVAQRMSAGRVSVPAHFGRPSISPSGSGRGVSFTRSGHFHASRPYWPLSLLSEPFFSDQYGGDQYEADYSRMPASPIFLLQAAAAAGPEPSTPQAQPLLIELQGDRYVQVSENTAEAAEPRTQPNYFQRDARASSGKSVRLKSQPNGIIDVPASDVSASGVQISRGRISTRTTGTRTKNSSGGVNASIRVHETPASRDKTARSPAPAVVVYRDGHREDVRAYAIADGVLYAGGDYYADGYWNKKIELSSLNLPATVKSNEERGVKFTLPSAPNEVVTRP
jgi:hypothetical protein